MSTKIEWTDLTTNPIRARYDATRGDGHYCEKIAPECARCYASRMQPRFRMPQFQDQRRLQGVEHYFSESHLAKVLDRKKPSKIFWCDMSDMFGAWVPDEWIDRCFAVMALTPQHTHQVLTKRPDRMRAYLSNQMRQGRINDAAIQHHNVPLWYPHQAKPGEWIVAVGSGPCWPLPNVWVGTSAGTQKSADNWIPELLQTPAAIRFVSVEPLLERVNLRPFLTGFIADGAIYAGPRLDWVIVGGESGQGARPTCTQHIFDVVAQCVLRGVPVFLKQFGSKAWSDGNAEEVQRQVVSKDDREAAASLMDYMTRVHTLKFNDPKGGDWNEWPPECRIRQFPTVAA